MTSFRRFWNSLAHRLKSESVSRSYERQTSHKLGSTQPPLDQLTPVDFAYPEQKKHVCGLYRRCDLCPDFIVSHEDPNVLNWAIRDHMYREHPTKGRRP